MSEPFRVAVVGGGISGLAAAWQLEQLARSPGNSGGTHGSDYRIDLFEADSRPGGKLQTRVEDGLTLELGAESFLSRKPDAVALCRELGLESRLRGTRPENRRTWIWHDGRLHRLPEGMSGVVPARLGSLMSGSLLPVPARLRVLADLVLPARLGAEDESVASFFRRRLGPVAWQRLVEPLLCGIWCADGEHLSLEATFPELRELEKQYGTLIGGLRQRSRDRTTAPAVPPFLALPGGMSELVDALRGRLTGRTRIYLKSSATSLGRTGSTWSIRVESGNATLWHQGYHAVILACPAWVASLLLRELNPLLAKQLAEIRHVTTATINIWFGTRAIRQPLNGYGFLIPLREQRGVTAVTWTSSKHFDRAPEGVTLLRAYAGRHGAEPDSKTTDGEILAMVRRELKRTMGLAAEPLGWRIHRWHRGSPWYSLGHLERLRQIAGQLGHMPGLHLCGASYRGVGIPDCIRDGRSAARQVHQERGELSVPAGAGFP